jgi:hypothetical protein
MKHFYLEMAFQQIAVGFLCVCLVITFSSAVNVKGAGGRLPFGNMN